MSFNQYIRYRKSAFDLVKTLSGDQIRYSSPVIGQPYWTHHMNVHNFLVSHEVVDYEVLIAAILHDVVEDYHVDTNYLSSKFTSRVVSLVRLVTKPTDWQPETYFMPIINSGDKGAMQIKVADRIDNILTYICYWDIKLLADKPFEEYQLYYSVMAKQVGWEKELASAMDYLKSHRQLTSKELELFVNTVSPSADYS